ncbi:hypothetical protein ACH0AB_02230 [Moraxella sp. 179-F 1C4 NHS]|nr:hypothetical protein [Moraxella osloensis]MBW4009317.1 hypothetical protein [Moraxella osloensis]
MKNPLIVYAILVMNLTSCASLPQTYDSPIPVYVDLGDAIPATTLPNSNSKANTKTMSH